MSASTPNPIRDNRIAFASTLTEFDDQRKWYSAKATDFKEKSQRLDLLVILCGALVAAIPILKPGGDPHWTEIAVSFLGAAVVVGQGAQRVFRYGEIWPEYRLASERMKREWRLFINARGQYSADEEVAKSLYTEALENIMAEEQKIFFNSQNKQVSQGDTQND